MLAYRTSHIYPQWVEDAVSASASPFYGNLGPSLSNLSAEPVSVGVAVVSGELRALLKTSAAADVVAFTPAIYSAELRTTLREVSAPADPLDFAASVVSGMLKQTLITYSTKEDVAAFSAAVVSGSLS